MPKNGFPYAFKNVDRRGSEDSEGSFDSYFASGTRAYQMNQVREDLITEIET